MAATSLPLPGVGAPGNPNFDGNPSGPPIPAAPGTDMTGICFRDQLWLNTFPLDRNLVFDYFALSPFYDWTCNNEQLRLRSIHPLDVSHLSKMTGNEYTLSEVMEPHLFVIRKQKRDNPEKTTPLLTYYILDGSIYQSPQLWSVFAARIGRAIYHISKGFKVASSKLEKIGYVDDKDAVVEPKAAKEVIDRKEIMRFDHILAQLQRRLSPAPPPPPFPEGYIPPLTSDQETAQEDKRGLSLPSSDPIIDQGPPKRLKYSV
ncbi:RNA polymerase transcriptional regulation mediator-like protein [Wolffia australiana]